MKNKNVMFKIIFNKNAESHRLRVPQICKVKVGTVLKSDYRDTKEAL